MLRKLFFQTLGSLALVLALTQVARADSLISSSGGLVNANASACVNVASDGSCQNIGTQQTGGNQEGNGSSLVRIDNGLVNANASACVNVASDGSCQSSASQNVGSSSTTVQSNSTTLVETNGGLVDANASVCANVLSNGTCQVVASQTTSTNNAQGVGGQILGAFAENLTGNLPRTGGLVSFSLLLAMAGAGLSYFIAKKEQIYF